MGRLMKYELRAAMKLLIPLWLGTLVLSFLNSFTMPGQIETDNPVLKTISTTVMVAYVLAVLAIVIITVIYLIMRFYQGLLKDEGYLTFTLPVSIDAILWSKALSGLILLAISGVVCVLSLMTLLWRTLNLMEFRIVLRELARNELVGTAIWTVLAAIFAAVCSGLSSIFQAYLAMGIGQMAKKRKLAASVLAYVVISTVVSTITTVGLTPLGNLLLKWIGYDSLIQLLGYSVNGPWLLLLGVALSSLFYGAVYYLLTRYIFKHKLNLE